MPCWEEDTKPISNTASSLKLAAPPAHLRVVDVNTRVELSRHLGHTVHTPLQADPENQWAAGR